MRGKSKSSHDLIDDPKLSSVPAVQVEVDEDKKNETKKRKIEDGDTASDIQVKSKNNKTYRHLKQDC